MLTRMAPEFAAGEHIRFMRKAASMSLMALCHDPVIVQLTESDRALVLQDFSRARRHILFNLKLKMSFWTEPPWSHMALGHSNEEVARKEAREALQRCTSAGPDAEHHWVTKVLCLPGGKGYNEMNRFAAGLASREQCPTIMYFAVQIRFVTVSERWIEGRHAQAKAHLRSTRNAGIVHTAFHGHFLFKHEALKPKQFCC